MSNDQIFSEVPKTKKSHFDSCVSHEALTKKQAGNGIDQCRTQGIEYHVGGHWAKNNTKLNFIPQITLTVRIKCVFLSLGRNKT